MEKKIASSLLILFLLSSCYVFAQKGKKTLWILYDSTDNLSEKVKETSFYFFVDTITTYSVPIGFTRTNSKKSLYVLKNLPKKIKLVSRRELLDILIKIPNSITTRDGRDIDLFESWYDRVYKKTYIVQKKEDYYLVYKVRMIYALY